MDGLVGAIIGGVVTGFTVWLTLSRQQRQHEIEAAVLALVRLQSAAGMLASLSKTKRVKEEAARLAYVELLGASIEARARLFLRWRDSAEDLMMAMDRLAAAGDLRGSRALSAVEAACIDMIEVSRKWLDSRQ